MFADPNLLGKLATNPRTSKHLADPAFVQKLRMLQTNPQLADGALNGDPRMIDVLGALMGIDLQGFGREDGSEELPPGFSKEAPSPPPKPSPPASQASTSKPTPPPAKVEEDIVMEEVDDDEAKAKKAAEAEKKLGAEAYKARDFESAVTHFSKAWDLWPKDVTFLTNLGGLLDS
jgi:stress-induced-phosphoprotein 1